MTRVFLTPNPEQLQDNNGVGRVVLAQYRYLPDCDIDLVASPDEADVIAAHITGDGLPRVDVLHCHGLYFHDIPHAPYSRWHHDANQRIIAAARQARAITVPSPWVAECFKRDMRITPDVIGHGIDLDEWTPTESHKGYILWNKNRQGDVCDPTPAVELARRGLRVVSTFGPSGVENLTVIGPQPHAKMKELVRHAAVYLATTPETFGIGTLEALAAGVPVVAYDWGGNAEIVTPRYLVKPGDIDRLTDVCRMILADRAPHALHARSRANCYSWRVAMGDYAELYHRIAREKANENDGVSVIVTNYNYGAYLPAALDSLFKQTQLPNEIIVVDDGSTDNSAAVLDAYEGSVDLIIRQANQGVAAARNAGIAAATQAHIICLDADDCLDEDYITTCHDAIISDRSLGVVYTGLALMDKDGGNIRPNQGFPPPFDWEAQSYASNPPATCIPCAAMFRKDMWTRAGGYKQVYAPGEDAEFFTRGLSVGFTAKKVSTACLFHYRVGHTSASRKLEYTAVDQWHPWMRDKRYPMAAPTENAVAVWSYSQPLMSVIVPVGPNHRYHVTAALDSLLGQTFRNWEVIVVEDGWVPFPHDYDCYPFVKRVPNVSGPHGAGIARNRGLAEARAPLCLFLDADDYLLPDAFMEMVKAYVANDGRYVYTDWWTVDAAGKQQENQADEYSQDTWLKRGWHATTVLMETDKARAVGGFDEAMPGWEDWDFFIKVALSGYGGVRCPQPLLVYREHLGSRRHAAFAERDSLIQLLETRYKGAVMGGCCGGNSDVIIQAKKALMIETGELDPEQFEKAERAAVDGSVRLEFVGSEQGSISYHGKKNRVYRAGNNSHDRFVSVALEDAERLLLTNKFRVVQRAGPLEESPPPDSKVFIETTESGPMLNIDWHVAPPPDPITPPLQNEEGVTPIPFVPVAADFEENLAAMREAEAGITGRPKRGRSAL